MSAVYITDPWQLKDLPNYPVTPFYDIEFWRLGNIVHEIIVKEDGFPPGVRFHRFAEERIRTRDAFLCSGLLMSPSAYNAGPSVWGFFLEHINSLRPSPGRLRLHEDVIHWEERVRTIFAERFSLGLAGWMLWSTYDVLHIADAGPFIAKTVDDPSCPYHKRSLQSLGVYGKNGGYKPDLFCLTKSGECVVAESKGAIGPPSKLTSDKKKGKEQVKNVVPDGVNLRMNGGRLVFATNLRHAMENPRFDKDSCITILDPDNDDEPFKIKASPDDIVLHSYCKLFSLCGHPWIVWLLLRGNPVEIHEPFFGQPVEIGQYRVLPLLRTNHYLIGLEEKIAGIIFRNQEGLASEVRRTLSQLEITSPKSTEMTLLLPNGAVFSMVKQHSI